MVQTDHQKSAIKRTSFPGKHKNPYLSFWVPPFCFENCQIVIAGANVKTRPGPWPQRGLVKTRRSWGRDDLFFSVFLGILKQNGRAFGIEEPYYPPVVSSVAVYVLLSLVLASQRSTNGTSSCGKRSLNYKSLYPTTCLRDQKGRTKNATKIAVWLPPKNLLFVGHVYYD